MKRNIPSVDRLSGLPDAVLCHILSFLPTNFSVATSILSRRWRFLWTEVPVLEFHWGDYYKYDCLVQKSWEDLYDDFAHIVDKVLLLHSVENLNTFRICLGDIICKDEQLETWITTVIMRKVQNLDLCLVYEVMLPQSVFTCKTLVDLTLVRVELLFPEAVCFPNLKKLHLIDVQDNTDEALPHLISGCPVLEKLVIDTVMNEKLRCISISSPTIKWLKLELTINGWEDDIHPYYRVEINAPSLRYLQLKDAISKDICLNNNEDDDWGYSGGNMLLEFIDKLYNVKYLTLSCRYYSKFLDLEFSASTVRFHNLTQLDLSADYRFISKFLENASNLQVLIIRQVYEDLKCWIEPQQVPACLSSHLTTIKNYSFNYAEHEFKMVRYLLKNSQVLKEMKIYSDPDISDYKKKFHGLKRISQFPRGSTACELYFN